jgi:hypothetical protein
LTATPETAMIALGGAATMSIWAMVYMVRDLLVKAGGLLFWPVFRQLDPTNSRRVTALKVVFFCHLAGFALLMGWLFLQLILFDTRAPHLIGHVHTLGKVSIAASCLALFLTRRKKPRPPEA